MDFHLTEFIHRAATAWRIPPLYYSLTGKKYTHILSDSPKLSLGALKIAYAIVLLTLAY